MTDREKAIVMAHTGICMLTGDKFRIFHKYVEDIIGRPIWTHDIGFLENEIKEKSKDDFIALCADEDGCVNYKNKCGDLISREETLTAFADYVGSGMSMNDYDALWDIVAKMPAVKQEPKFIAKADGTIEQVKNCDDCLFKKEWEKIGKLLSVVLKIQIDQEPKTGHWEQYGNSWEDKYKCSECGKEQPKILCGERIIGHWSDYCPNCGAWMVEPQERSE